MSFRAPCIGNGVKILRYALDDRGLGIGQDDRCEGVEGLNGDSIKQTFEGFISQTLYSTELDLSRQVLDDLDWAARVYGIKRSQVADSILKAAFQEYRGIIEEHEGRLAQEEQ